MHQTGAGNDSVTVVIDEPIGKASLIVEEFGCFSEPAEINLKRKPHFDFLSENREGCQPFLSEIFADPKDSDLSFYWLSDTLPPAPGDSHLYLFPGSGTADIGLTAYSSETGCADTLIKKDWINIHPKPVAAFDVDYSVALIENAKITFTNKSEDADIYSWDFGDGNSSNSENTYHTYTEQGSYNSRLTAESIYGCRDTSEQMITILPFSVYAPNAFRPDSPVDENRTFRPVGTGADPLRFNLKIYNRWGQIVFETDSPDEYWNGDINNGKPAPMANYIWIAQYFDIQGFKHEQKGQVLLIR